MIFESFNRLPNKSILRWACYLSPTLYLRPTYYLRCFFYVGLLLFSSEQTHVVGFQSDFIWDGKERRNGLGRTAGTVWAIPDSAELQQELKTWLSVIDLSPTQQEQIFERWNRFAPISSEQRFQCLINSLRTVSTPIAMFLEECDQLEWSEPLLGQKRLQPVIPDLFPPVEQEKGQDTPLPRLRAALTFYLVQRLIRSQRFNEAARLLENLTPENSVDPLSVLLHKAIIHNQRREKTAGLSAIHDFFATLPSDPGISRRSQVLAGLLKSELEQLSEQGDTLPDISRQVSELRRHFEWGETNQPVQQLGEEVVQSLDRLIERLERDQNGDDGQSQSSDNKPDQRLQPVQESRINREKGEGEVLDQNFQNSDSWGNLPVKEREESLRWIDREFPAHYRNIIEHYFRQLANEK
ncbi:MAG: hypothetical protein ACRC10_11190 [Thermoguttaceae bacterium]